MHLIDIATAQPCLHNNGNVFTSKTFLYKKFIYGDDKRFPYNSKSFCIPINTKSLNFSKIKFSRSGLIINEVATLDSVYQNLRIDNEVGPTSADVDAYVDGKEKLRRMRISKANKGNTPWNKGKKHSTETKLLIKKMTRLAMQDPKVKMKLVNFGHAQSEETRIKIGVGVRIGWEKRREKLLLQETCFYEWQNLLAQASKNGLFGEESLEWDSYAILNKQLEQEWLQSIEERKKMRRPKGSKRARKSPEQRKKISDAIAAKWADPGYRTRVTSALAKYHGIPEGVERKVRKKSGEGGTRKRNVKKKVDDVVEFVKFKVKKSKVARFKDPLASSKLEILKSIRAQRLVSGNKTSEAIANAKGLIAEAEKAAKALEEASEKSPLAYASLIETRKLIAEAIESLESAESHSDKCDISARLSSSAPVTISEEEVEEIDHKYVNGTHVLGTSVNTHSNGTLNGKENLFLRSGVEYDVSPEEVYSGEMNGVKAFSEEKKLIIIKKKWVKGRLVEVVEGESN